MRNRTRERVRRKTPPTPSVRPSRPGWLRGVGRAALGVPRLLVSVRVRLALWYLAILGIVFLVFGGVVYKTTAQNVENAQNAALVSLSQQLLRNYNSSTGLLDVRDPFTNTPKPSSGGKPAVTIAKDSPSLLGPDDIAVLYDSQTNYTQRLGPITDQGAADLHDIVRLRHDKFGAAQDTWFFSDKLSIADSSGGQTVSDYVLVSMNITANGQNTGTLVVGQPSQAGATLRNLVPGLLLAGPLTLLVAALGGYWVASRAMRPVRLITRAAQAIGENDLSRRLRLKRRDELGDLAATFDHMLDRLEAAFTRQRQFTADASHELRTPLTVVDLEVTRGLTARQPPEEYERILAAVRAENAHMSRLVEDLLMLARADTGQAQLRPEPLDLSDVALEALERLAPLARERQVELVAGALPELRVVADRAALTRLFVNLIENGVKYTTGAHARVTLTTGSDSAHGAAWAWARVADNGSGIADEHLPHIFERFYRVDAARERADVPSEAADGASGGSGLGLAIARWVAEAHGGSITVSGAPGVGSVFEARLPLVAD